MDVTLLTVLVLVAAIGGNTLNYAIGRGIGMRVYQSNWRFLDKKALQRTHDFYERHGGKTIVLARFMPVVRTFAPFVAGVSGMRFGRFQMFNVASALLWVLSLVLCGYFFGNLPYIKQYLNVIVLVGVAAAAVPVAFGALWKLMRQKTGRLRQSGAAADRVPLSYA